jgi:hypothetical protein
MKKSSVKRKANLGSYKNYLLFGVLTAIVIVAVIAVINNETKLKNTAKGEYPLPGGSNNIEKKCKSDNDCKDNEYNKKCFKESGKCVEDCHNVDCKNPKKPFCQSNPGDNICVGCLKDSDCKDNPITPHCRSPNLYVRDCGCYRDVDCGYLMNCDITRGEAGECYKVECQGSDASPCPIKYYPSKGSNDIPKPIPVSCINNVCAYSS